MVARGCCLLLRLLLRGVLGGPGVCFKGEMLFINRVSSVEWMVRVSSGFSRRKLSVSCFFSTFNDEVFSDCLPG